MSEETFPIKDDNADPETKLEWEKLFVNHPLRPYILKANRDLRGGNQLYYDLMKQFVIISF